MIPTSKLSKSYLEPRYINKVISESIYANFQQLKFPMAYGMMLQSTQKLSCQAVAIIFQIIIFIAFYISSPLKLKILDSSQIPKDKLCNMSNFDSLTKAD